LVTGLIGQLCQGKVNDWPFFMGDDSGYPYRAREDKAAE
jgi:hypothetical protein